MHQTKPPSTTIYLSLLSLLFSLPLSSQEYILEEQFPIYQVENIEKIFFQAIYEDARGLLWFGSQEGLFKYNGKETVIYEHDPDDSLSIADNWVNSIDEDEEGNLWLALSSGVNKFDPQTGWFRHYRHDPDNEQSLISDLVWDVMVDKKGLVWAATLAGVSRFDPEGRSFKHWKDLQDPVLGKISEPLAVFYDASGQIWVLYYNALGRYDETSETFRFFQPPDYRGENYYFGNYFLERSGTILLSGPGVFWRFDPKGEKWTRLNLGGNRIQQSGILPINKETYLVSLVDGLAYYHTDRDSWTEIKIDPFLKENFNFGDYAAAPIFEDNGGNIWLVGGLGMHKVGRYREAIRYFQIKTGDVKRPYFYYRPEASGSPFYNSLYPVGKHHIGIGKELILDLENPRIQPLKEVYPDWATERGFVQVCRDRQGILWRASVDDRGLWVEALDPRTKGKTDQFFIEKEKLWFGNIFDSQIDRAGNYWVGTWNGLYRYHIPSGKLTKYTNNPEDRESLSTNAIRTIQLDHKDRLWIGTDGGGLNRYEPDSDSFVRYLSDPNDTTSISGNRVQSILEGKDGLIWINTESTGLNSFDPVSETFRRYGKKDGLADRSFGMEEDNTGNIWSYGGWGITQINPQPLRVKRFGQWAGIQEGIWEQSSVKGGNGALVFGGSKGFHIVYPELIKANTHQPPVYITGFQLFNQDIKPGGKDSILTKDISYTEEIRLKYDQNVFSLQFAALDYTNPEDNQYAYQLIGFDKDWQYIGNKNEATYTNLDPGTYTFRVKASNNEGLWNEEGATLRIVISPPWYWAWYTKTLYLLALISGLYALYLWRTREQREKILFQERELQLQEQTLAQEQLLNVRLQQIDKLKDQFLANTSHELRTPLHGIVGIAESLFESVKKKSAEEIQTNLGMIMASGRRLTNLVNDLLDFSRVKNKDLQLQQKSISLRAVADVVLHSCRPLVGNQPIKLQNDIPADLPPVLADDNRLQQILFNLVGNAVKFTREGFVKVNATMSPAGLPAKAVTKAGGGLRGWKASHDIDESKTFHPPTPASGGEDTASDQIIICVEDTGIGIPADKHEAIFQSFEQVDGDATREFSGTGLGLSITKQLVELHGGQIWVESNPGEGAKFFFTLPVADEKAVFTSGDKPGSTSNALSPAGLPAEAWAKAGGGKGGDITHAHLSLPLAGSAEDRIRILVVDDEPINHQVLKNHLSDDQFMITSVMGGQQAIEAIDLGVKFDLVLLDVMMPRISGYQVCQHIREKYLPSELPVIMVTAKNQIQDLVEGLAVGANDYLAKPFSRDEFLARVKTQLDLHRINSITSKFVPNAFIRALGRERITEVGLGDHTEKRVTVLFSDIRSYTTLAESMTPGENYKFVNAFHRRMGPVIRSKGGFINQYLGDAVMAIFPDDPDQAVQAAVGMHQALQQYNLSRAAKGRQFLRMGIGLHTGSLIMGIIGDEERLDAATIADTVNTASRIENLTKYFGANILLSEDSMPKEKTLDVSETSTILPLRYLGQVQVKGKSEPVDIYECFGGDHPEQVAKKRETRALFQEGLEAYLGRNFAGAVARFQAIIDHNSEDATARHFLNKAAGLITTGVPEDWTGVEVLTFK